MQEVRTTICQGASTVIGTPSVVNTTYSWAPSTGLNMINIAQPVASPSSTTTYTLTQTTGSPCTVSTSTVTITVTVPQTQYPVLTDCPTTTATITASGC